MRFTPTLTPYTDALFSLHLWCQTSDTYKFLPSSLSCLLNLTISMPTTKCLAHSGDTIPWGGCHPLPADASLMEGLPANRLPGCQLACSIAHEGILLIVPSFVSLLFSSRCSAPLLSAVSQKLADAESQQHPPIPDYPIINCEETASAI